MKVLTIKNPWAFLIMFRGKDVENRTWETKYRGPLLIHASKKPEPQMFEILSHYRATLTYEEFKALLDCCGCIIGSVQLIDCVRNSRSKWAESDCWHWILSDPNPIKPPIPARGSLGLWDFNFSMNIGGGKTK